MRLKSVALSDFGIFQDQALEQLGEGLVVIGGANRAGKTTFMAALRCLGFKVPKKPAFYPARERYQLGAAVERDGFEYSICINGHGKPKVVAQQEAPEMAAEALYNNLDRFTYRQIFTISLDELRQLPDNMENGEHNKLGAVLLGAGWNDALILTELSNKLNREANKTGAGGEISASNFDPYYSMLCRGLELRDLANAQMDMYEEKCSRLEELGGVRIPALERKIAANQLELQRLELVGERYLKYGQYRLNRRVLEAEENRKLWETYPPRGLEQAESLQEEYGEALEKQRAAREKFLHVTGEPAGGELPPKLLQAGRDLEGCEGWISGWEARIKTVQGSRSELTRRTGELKEELAQLYAPWGREDGLRALDAVETDQSLEQDLQKKTGSLRDLEHELRQQERDLAELEAELESLDGRRVKWPPAGEGLMKKVSWLAAANVLLVLCLGLLLPPGVAVTAGLAAAVAVFAYFYRENSRAQARAGQLGELEKEIGERQTKKEALLARREQVRERLEEVQRDIAVLKDECRIPEQVDVAFLPEFVRSVRQLQRQAGQLKEQGKKLDCLEAELEKELLPLTATLASINMLEDGFTDVLGRSHFILDQLKKGLSFLKAARELRRAERDVAEVERSITALLQSEQPAAGNDGSESNPFQRPAGDESFDAASHSTPQAGPAGKDLSLLLAEFVERGRSYAELAAKWQEDSTLRQVLTAGLESERWRSRLLGGENEGRQQGAADETEALLAAFAAWCEEYDSVEQVRAVQGCLQEESGELENELQRCRDEKRDLEKEVQELGTDAKLLEARQLIDEARKGIKDRLEKYAVRKVAALLLQRTRERLMEQTKDALLAPAGEVFRRLTGEAYGNIEVPNSTASLQIRACPEEGQEQDVDALSRATREQLFFAMRLSRIRDIKPALPVIFDDTFTNFDPAHLREAVSFLVELAETHQVFVLTCHPQLLEHIRQQSGSRPAQYWQLKEGRFNGPYADPSEVRQMLLQG